MALGAVTAGLAASSVAVGAFATQSLSAFTSFEQGINEVFTLLPGITDEAMSGMETSVQRFMNTTGRVSEEALPALYQALSAGVPQDNVFDFLELANQAAIGGVTDLETAVDGISSVINAYGTDVLSATEASDLMFTAVRLGKTNFEELSASLFNVVPVASAVGVSFEDITAGLATITAQGVPTSVATTQLRQLFVELSDAGTDVGEIFEEIAGKSFTEFMEAGNDTGDALALLTQYADEAGIPIQQLFGSIEAGQAVLALTSGDMEVFNNNLDAMANSGGATQTAFEQMNDTMQQSINILKARFQSALISTGRLLVPFIQPLVDVFGTLFAIFEAGAADGETLSDWLGDLPGFLRPVGFLVGQLGAFLFSASNAFAEFIGYLEAGLDPLASLQTLIFQIAGANAANAFIRLAIGIQDIVATISTALSPIAQWLSSWVTMQDVMVALGLAIASVIVPAIVSLAVALAVPLAIFGALVAGIALLRNAWENNFLGMRDAIQNTWIPALQSGLSSAQTFFTGLWDAFQEGGFSGGGNFIMDNLVTPIVTGLTNAWNTVDWSNVASTLFDLWGTALNAYITAELWIFNNIVSPVFNKLIEVIDTIDWGAVGTSIMDGIGIGLTTLFNFATWVVDNVLTPLKDNAQTAIESTDWFAVGEGVMNAIGAIMTATFDYAVWVSDYLFTPIVDESGNATGQVGWEVVGENIMGAIGAVLGAAWDFVTWLGETIITPMIAGAVSAIANADWSTIGSGIMSAISSAFPNLGQWAQTNLIDPLSNAVSGSSGNLLSNAGNAIGQMFGFGGNSPSPINFGSVAVRQFGGYTDKPVMTGENGRELFIPSQSGNFLDNQETEQLMGGKGNITVNFNFSGRITEDEARRSARVVVDELTALGVNLN